MKILYGLTLVLLSMVLFGCTTPEGGETEVENIETVDEGPKDCGTDFDCFIAASVNCEPATATYLLKFNLFGMILDSETAMELKGLENGKCVYQQRTESVSVEFSEGLKQQLLDSNQIEEEIAEQEKASNEEAQTTVGTEVTCKMDTEDLTAAFTRWKQGTYSTGDLPEEYCERVLPQ